MILHNEATPERRRRRSQDPLVALHYQLAYARTESRMEAIVVADDAGLVVAASGSWAACEELAAYAPILATGGWTEPGLIQQSRVAELRSQVDIRPVEVEGQTVLLCSRGGNPTPGAMGRAAQGVVRILSRAA
jgi:hypothetical protein